MFSLNFQTVSFAFPYQNSTDVYVVFPNFFGLKIFKPVWFLFPFVSDYGNEYWTKENKN